MCNIQFKDKGFEQKVREVINKVKGKLTSKDILKIKGILISDQDGEGLEIPWLGDSSAFSMFFPEVFFNINNSENGKWIEDLANNFEHIRCLYILIPTESISFLKDFKNLKELYVMHSDEKDWRFIENLLLLRYLFLSKCKFSDLKPISNLCRNQKLEFEKTKNEDDIFNVYLGLNHLGITFCGISDLKPLSDCKSVYELNLSYNEVEDISALTNIEGLYYLTLRYNRIKSIDALKDCRSLYYLNLRHNYIEDVAVLKEFEGYNHLGRLFLGHNKIKNFDAIKNLNLVYTDIE